MGATSGNPHAAGAEDDIELSATDEETLVLQLVKQDPFQTISELRDEVNRRHVHGIIESRYGPVTLSNGTNPSGGAFNSASAFALICTSV